MMNTFFGRWIRRFSRSLPAAARRRPVSAKFRRPWVELLEDRTAPSVTIAPTNNNGQGYAALDFNQSSGGFTPPDTCGAAGPTNYVETVNQTVAIYGPKATGASVTKSSLSTFWFTTGGLAPVSGGILSDPIVVYNDQIGRFIVGDQNVNFNTHVSTFDIAVSNTGSPATLTTGDWKFYRIVTTQTGLNADYPGNFGYNHDAFVVTLNMFAGNTPAHVQVISVNNADLANGVAQSSLHFFKNDDLNGGFSERPTAMHDSVAGDPMWLVTEHRDGNSIDVIKMTNVLSTSASFGYTNLAVTPYNGITFNPPLNPNGSQITNNIDSRIDKAAEWNNLLVAAHSVPPVNNTTEDDVQWYAVDMSGAMPALKDQGRVSAGNNTYLTYPSIEVNASGQIGMTYMRSGTDTSTDYLSMYVTGRLPSDPAGTMEASVLVPAGTGKANYHDFSGGGRAGDLSGINVDPSDGSFWGANEFANTEATANWGTAVANFTIATATSTTHLSVTPSASSSTAGTAFSVTVSALTASNAVDPTYRGTIHFTSSDTRSGVALPGNYTFVAADNGVHTFTNGVTLVSAGNQSVAAADTQSGTITGSATVTVNPAAASTLAVAGFPAPATAGTAGTFTVTAKDPYGNTATGYTGTVHFTSSDAQAVLPADATLTNGAGSFTATLKTAGPQSLTATDTVTASIIGSQTGITVNPAAASTLVVAGFPSAVTAGTAGTVTVTAKDSYGNTATGYAGTVHFTSSDAQAVLPADSTLTNGAGSFTVTLKTAGPQSLTATDTVTASLTGSQTGITVNPAAVSTLLVAGFPSPVTAGTAGTFTVTAQDPYGNTIRGYVGTVHFTSSDGQAVLPADSALTKGTGSFSATLKTAGPQSLTATDITTTSITGSQSGITVNPAAASTLVVAGFPSPSTAGVAGAVAVTAKDPYGNAATAYTGTVHFTSSDGQAVLPADSTLTNGTGSFTATLKTAGVQSLTATDTATAGITGSQAGITINPAAASSLVVSGFPSTTTAGTAGNFLVTAKDPYGNKATGYAGTVHFTSSDGQAVLPANSTLTNGAGSFTATLKTAGPQSLTATDTVVASVTGSQSGITVNPAAVSTLVVTGFPSSATAGTAGTFTVTAKDPYGNTTTGYSGTAHFTSSDAQAVLPADSTLTNGTGSFTATLKTAGAQSLTATDTATASITGSQSGITVNPAAASTLVVAGFPSLVTAGAAGTFAVTAKDAYGNTATGYAGMVHFKSSDGQAALPADSTLTNGTGSFTATLKTAGTQSLTGTDTVTASITGSQAGITVNPAAASTLAVAGLPSAVTAGTAGTFTVTAKDPYGNTATGYAGTVHFTSSDGQAALPANSTLGNGTGSFTVTLKTAGQQSLTATDTVTASITGSQSGITVNPAAASTLAVAGFPSAVTAGTAGTFAVTAKDPYGNTATGYAGTVHFTSSDGQAALPANSTLTNGTGSFSATFKTAAAQSLTATDTVTASITGSQSGITVNPAAASTLVVAGFPSPVNTGTAGTFTVTAKDPYSNVATGYGGTIHFTSSDGQLTAGDLPADYTFAAADHGSKAFTATLRTPGTQSITATDTASSLITGTQTGIVVNGALLVDTGSQGYSETGTGWYTTVRTGYSAHPRADAPGNGSDTATWQVSGLAAGYVTLQATWNPYSDRAPNAAFQIYDGSTLLKTVVVNQTQNPTGSTTVNGWVFQDLATLRFTSGTIKVVLSNNASGYVVADAVRFVVLPAPVIDLNWNGGGITGPTATNTASTFTISRTYNITGAAPTSNFTIGYYASTDQVFAHAFLLGTETISAAADKTVGTHAGTSPALQFPVGGTYYLFANLDDGNAILETDKTNNVAQAPQQINVAAATPVIVSTADPGYSEAGTGWYTTVRTGYSAHPRADAPGTGSDTAAWQATGFAAGTYITVQATWNPYSDRAPNAAFQIYDGTTLVKTVIVNQTQNPAGSTTVNGWVFQDLATLKFNSGTVKVVLSNNAAGYVVADAVRFAPQPAPVIDLNWNGGGITGPTATNTASTFTISRTYNITGAAPTSNFTIGYYASTDQVFAHAFLLGTETISAAADKTVGTHAGSSPALQFAVGGTYYLFAHLDDGNAILETDKTNNTAQAPQQINVTVATPIIVSTADSGYSETGTGWYSTIRSGYSVHPRADAPGTGSDTATWQMSGYTAGANVTVQVTWNPYTDRASNAPFQIYDGTTLLATVLVDQTQNPTGSTTVNGWVFQNLGSFKFNSGTVKVVLSNNANGYVVADALRLVIG